MECGSYNLKVCMQYISMWKNFSSIENRRDDSVVATDVNHGIASSSS